jgi:uncharacterized protein (DUF302 family)
MNYYFSKFVDGNFDAIREKVVGLLKEEGFAVKSEIDIAATFREKLGVEFKNYYILGACNPGFAYDAINAEDKLGVLLPCNVVLIEQEAGRIEVAAMDAATMMSGLGNPGLVDIAAKVNEHIRRVVDNA